MSVCAKTLLLWEIQPKQNLSPGDPCPTSAGRTGCTGVCDTQLHTQGQKTCMKSEYWAPQIRNPVIYKEVCWFSAFTAGVRHL